MRLLAKNGLLIRLLSVCLTLVVHAHAITGRILHVDVKNRCFELLKDAEQDSKNDAAKAPVTVHWTDQTTIYKAEAKTSFAGIKGPIIAEFRGIDAANQQALSERKPFVARVATLLDGIASLPEPVVADNQVTAWFTPDEGEGSRKGEVVLDGNRVAVSLRDRNWQIVYQKPLRPEELAHGFWQATLTGSESGGRFVVSRVDVVPQPGETFDVEGRPAFLMLPPEREASKPTPWVWYAPTLPKLPGKEERWMFENLLSYGIAIGGVDVGESMGNPAGRAIFTAFYQEMITRRGMSAKPCLLARSRGGLMHYNWAAENPLAVAGIAGVYPVGNLASWPGLARACGAYGLTEDGLAAQLADHNPIDRLAPLVKHGIPILHLHGDNDKVVPLDRNSGLIKARYDELGGQMTIELIKGGGHDMNPQWFQSRSLVDFMIRQAGKSQVQAPSSGS